MANVRRNIGREVGPYWVAVESDTLGAKEMVKVLEETAEDVNNAINDITFIRDTAGEIPKLPDGTTPTDGIIRILHSRYGIHPRTLNEIRVALESNGIYYPVTTISSILVSLYNQRKVRRWKVNKRYVYQKGSE